MANAHDEDKVKSETVEVSTMQIVADKTDQKQKEDHKNHNHDVETVSVDMVDNTRATSGEYNEYKQHPTGKDEEIRRLAWKRDRRIFPLVCLFFLFSYLDRVNIGNAKIAGIVEDLNMTESQFNGALSIFFAGYIVFEVPANMALNKLGPKIWMPILMLTWGAIMCAMAAVKTGPQLLVARFFLGVAESGLMPGILLYLSIWYTKKEIGKRVAIFYASTSAAGAFGGVLAFGVMHMEGLQGMSGWQWIFIIEAIPTLLLSIACYLFLPDYPEKTTFLTESERQLLADMKAPENGAASEEDTEFSSKQFCATFLDWKTYAYSVIALCFASCAYSISMFLPSIVMGMGFTAITAQAMASPPFVIACIFVALNGISSDRRNERGLHSAVFLLVAVLGYSLLIGLQERGTAALYVCTAITATGVYSGYPPVIAWYTNNFVGRTKQAVSIAIINSIANVGGIIAGQIYRAEDAPHYTRGHAACLSLMANAAICVICLKMTLILINKKRDSMIVEDRHAIIVAEDELCDKHPDFRYTT